MLEKLLQEIQTLTPEQQKNALTFIQNLKTQTLTPAQILALPLPQRHQYLDPFIPPMAEDFLNDPELTEFNTLDSDPPC